MCGHVYGKVSEAPPQLRGLGTTECVCVCVCVLGLFNHAVLGEVHGSVTGDDPRGEEPAECAELCAHCEAADKHPDMRWSGAKRESARKGFGRAALSSPFPPFDPSQLY